MLERPARMAIEEAFRLCSCHLYTELLLLKILCV